MKIKLKNGSVIEPIYTDSDNVRSKRGNDYLNRLREENNNSFFDIEDLKKASFNLKELDNKILRMIVAENEGIRIIAGQDMNTGKVYVLSCEQIREEN
jgi:hypothetical protein